MLCHVDMIYLTKQAKGDVEKSLEALTGFRGSSPDAHPCLRLINTISVI